jgi:hypothetical protein
LVSEGSKRFTQVDLKLSTTIQKPIFQFTSRTRSRQHGIDNRLDVLAGLLLLPEEYEQGDGFGWCTHCCEDLDLVSLALLAGGLLVWSKVA